MMTYNENSCGIFSDNEVYVFDKERGQLLQVLIEETVFERDSYDLGKIHSRTYASIVSNNEKIEIDECEVYRTRLDFEHGKQIATRLCNPFKLFSDVVSGDECWTFQHGCPVCIKLSDISVVTYDYMRGRFFCDELPYHTYISKEDCLSYNEYEIVDEEGTRTIKGCNSLLQLTDSQVELVKQFEDLCKRMRNEGILIASNCCESFRAYNVRDCEDYEFNFANDASEGYEQCDRDCGRFVNVTNIYESGDDFELYIKRK